MMQQVFRDFIEKQNVTLLIMAMALLMCRILPVIILTPFLGGETVPAEVKIGVGLTLGLVLFPAVLPTVHRIPISAVAFIALLAKELFLGIALSFVVNLVFAAAEVAGTLADMMSGSNMAQLMVPQIGQQVTLFTALKVQIAVVLFVTLNGHHVVIEAFAESLLAIPLDGYPQFSKGLWPFFELCARIFSDIFVIGFALAAPAFLATFVTDIALGAINRVSPQIQVFFISMAIKPMVAAAIVLVSIHLILQRMETDFSQMLRLLRRAIGLLT